MTRLEIRLEGDPVLRQKATKITRVDDSIRKLAADMWETLEEAEGVGLAAPQVGVSRRLVIVHLPEDYIEEGDPEISLTLINPEIVRSRGAVVGMEGCLSIPGWQGEVERADQVTVRALGLDGRELRIRHEGWVARVLQHEIDHLDGILYTDRMREEDAFYRVEQHADEAEDQNGGVQPLAGTAAAGRD
ncbi:MAG TPA: peptide deformylase [Thermomicrobiales bacterium]|jgi:peptide deformylase|nr:peptide deformylase [Thermomicrobiales bacterium]